MNFRQKLLIKRANSNSQETLYKKNHHQSSALIYHQNYDAINNNSVSRFHNRNVNNVQRVLLNCGSSKRSDQHVDDLELKIDNNDDDDRDVLLSRSSNSSLTQNDGLSISESLSDSLFPFFDFIVNDDINSNDRNNNNSNARSSHEGVIIQADLESSNVHKELEFIDRIFCGLEAIPATHYNREELEIWMKSFPDLRILTEYQVPSTSSSDQDVDGKRSNSQQITDECNSVDLKGRHQINRLRNGRILSTRNVSNSKNNNELPKIPTDDCRVFTSFNTNRNMRNINNNHLPYLSSATVCKTAEKQTTSFPLPMNYSSAASVIRRRILSSNEHRNEVNANTNERKMLTNERILLPPIQKY